MSYLEPLILGIIQGLTEFLPVSSSGHLEIGKALFDNESVGHESLFLTLVLHFGTALSTVVVFRKDLFELVKSLVQFKSSENNRFSLKILLSMLPAIIVGLFLQQQIEQLFSSNLLLVGFMLVLTSILLFLADRPKKNNKQVSYANALVLGIVQAVAILPGISRSGSTIACAVLLGIEREKAARFSFLMVLPLIFGSMAKTVMDYEGSQGNTDLFALFIGFGAAFISGIMACRWMIAIVKNSQLKYFSYYCILVGVLTLVYGLF